MSIESRRRLVYRLDLILIVALLLTSGLAALLFALEFDSSDDDAIDAAVEIPTATRTAVATATLLPTMTATPHDVLTETATLTPTVTSTATPTITQTMPPAPTVTITASATLTHTPEPSATVPATATSTATATPQPTATPTSTPWPTPAVDALPTPIYASQPVTMTGQAQPRDTIHLYDQGQWVMGVVADDTGHWVIELPGGLSEGLRDLTMVAVSVEGAVSESAQVQVRVQPAPTDTPMPTATPTDTPLPTATLTMTPSATHTATSTVTATATQTPSPSATTTPAPTATATVVAVVPTDTPTPLPSATPTALPTVTNTATSVPTATQTAIPTHTSTATLPPAPESPQITAVPSELVVGEPVTLEGAATPGQTVIVSVESNVVGEILVQESGTWSLDWTPATAGPVVISVVATDSGGQQSAPATIEATVWSIRPRIDVPQPGAVVAPGPVSISGIAQPGTTVTIQNVPTGEVLGTVTVPDNGSWATTITLSGDGDVTLIAVVAAADGSALSSVPVVVTIAPPLHSDTGAVLETADADETGRTFTALLALLLVAGGFSIVIAGRVLTLWARDRT